MKTSTTPANRWDEFICFVNGENTVSKKLQTILNSPELEFKVYGGFGTLMAAKKILVDLKGLSKKCAEDLTMISPYVVVFEIPRVLTRKGFSGLLKQQIQFLQTLNTQHWNLPILKDDVSEDEIEFSFMGKMVALIPMHPNSEDKKRQSPQPTLVIIDSKYLYKDI